MVFLLVEWVRHHLRGVNPTHKRIEHIPCRRRAVRLRAFCDAALEICREIRHLWLYELSKVVCSVGYAGKLGNFSWNPELFPEMCTEYSGMVRPGFGSWSEQSGIMVREGIYQYNVSSILNRISGFQPVYPAQHSLVCC